MLRHMRLLVTGGAGFIGSNFARYWVEQHPEDHVVVYDVLTYAGNRPNLSDVEDRIAFIRGDVCDPLPAAEKALHGEAIDTVVHFAAESHNSLAVRNPGLFFRTNVLGTQTMLKAARQVGVARFHHVSTCEVYGDLPLDTDEVFTEDSPYRPRTPYNTSKAGADSTVRAYAETYGLPSPSPTAPTIPAVPFPEKLIPHFCALALDDEPLTLYASTENRREWLHVRDRSAAIDAVLVHGRVGETYHVGSGVEASITEVADRILAALDKSPSLKTIVPDRPGHDRRYVLDSSKLQHRTGLGAEFHRLGAGPGGHRGVVRLTPRLVGTAASPGADRRRRLGNRRRLTGANPRHGGRRPVGSRPARRPGGKGAVRRSPVRAARAGGAA